MIRISIAVQTGPHPREGVLQRERKKKYNIEVKKEKEKEKSVKIEKASRERQGQKDLVRIIRRPRHCKPQLKKKINK